MIKIDQLRRIARRYKNQLKTFSKIDRNKTIQGKQVFKDNCKTVIIVSHEASETGAPIRPKSLYRVQ